MVVSRVGASSTATLRLRAQPGSATAAIIMAAAVMVRRDIAGSSVRLSVLAAL
jgi:hypothetical protein